MRRLLQTALLLGVAISCGEAGAGTHATAEAGNGAAGSDPSAGSPGHGGAAGGASPVAGSGGSDVAQAGTATSGAGSSQGGDSAEAGAGGAPPELPARPNIVVILDDDQGWNGTSVQMQQDRTDSKSDYYQTPNIERLSRLGMTFSNGYGAPNCSPSRLSLLTGKSPARLKMTDIIERNDGSQYNGHPLLPPGHVDNPTNRIYAAPTSEETIAEMIKAHDPGYATAHFGKWHLSGGGPAAHGFDESDGATSNAEGQVGGDDPKLVFSLAEKAKTFIKKQAAAQKPFYLQVSHYAVHEASFALASTVAKYQGKMPGVLHKDPVFAAMTEDLDTSIGRLLDALQDPNGDGDETDSLLPRTYIFLLADNGAVDTISDNLPLMMGKASTWEGGVRVPFLLAGPGIAAGSRSNVPVDEYDILPTIADWLGATPAHRPNLDGGSLSQLARGELATVQGRGTQFVFHFPHYQVAKGSKPMSSIREGNLKLVHFYETGESHLFDLSSDIEEQHDLAAEQPQNVKLLRRELRDYLKGVKAPMPRLNPEFGVGTFPDVDKDGLNDDWEFRELLTTAYSGSDDPDGDGQDNATELAKKTDPLP